VGVVLNRLSEIIMYMAMADSLSARREPDRASAMFALRVASEHLGSASEFFSKKKFHLAFETSRNAIRIASSALMLRDGYISDTFEGTAGYLLDRYPGTFPVHSWGKLEMIQTEASGGLYLMILSFLGKLKKAGEQDARDALAAAKIFVGSAREEMML
jgi:hypothetical protein